MKNIINFRESKFETLQKFQMYLKKNLGEKFKELLSLQLGTQEYKDKIQEMDESKFLLTAIEEEIKRDFPVELENLKNRKVG
jgi:hypothetical protein